MKHRVILAAVWTVLVLPAIAQTTLLVPSQYPTIQAGIVAAQNGDTVLVAPGSYVENINFLGKAITVTSSGGAAVTTMVGDGSNRVVTFQSNEGAASILSAFTITGGGGGIIVQNASPTITNCTIMGNTSSDGGGIWMRANYSIVSPSITSCRVIGNLASYSGGGVYGEGSNGSCSPVITGSVIATNYCYASYQSGAPTGGGGAFFQGGGSPVFDGCTIADNSCFGNGGGLEFLNTNVPPVVRMCRITDNVAMGGIGGGINAGPITLQGCVITGNSAPTSGGGGLSCSGATVVNCTFANNAAAVGSAMSGSATITNSIIWANSGIPVVPFANGLIATYSNLPPGLFSSNPTNISLDPLFIDAPNGDFHLASNSPCRDTGTNGVGGLPSADFDGTSRIQGGAVDMGADEIPVVAYPGTADGLDLYARINGAGDPLASTRVAGAGNLLTVTMKSSSSALVGGLPVFAADLFPTGAPPAQVFPAVWLDAQAIIIYGTLSTPPFGFPGLPPGGLEFSFTVPPGLAGTTVRMQSLVSSINTLNGIYATSNATEVTF